MLKNYLKIAWRNLIKNKVTGFINIIGLAIGMAVAMMIGLWLRDELTFNKSHENYDTIARLMVTQIFGEKIGTSPAMSLPYRDVLVNDYGDDIEHVARVSWESEHLIANGDKRFLQDGMYVDSNFLEIFTPEMISGDYQTALFEPNSIVLAESLAKLLFGEEDPMGKTVRFDAMDDMEVTGVYVDFPSNSTFKELKLFAAYALYVKRNSWVERSLTSWKNHSFPMFAQIKEGRDFKTVTEKFKHVEREYLEEGNPEAFLMPMSEWHLYDRYVDGKQAGGRIQYVWLFSIIAVFVLILACINFMNLSTARSERRAKEVGVRKSVGSLRSQLIAQFFTESFLVTGLAMVFSLVLLQMSLGWFNELAGKEMILPLGEPIFWIGLIGFTFLTGLISGSYPAFYLSSFSPIKALKGTFKAGRWAGVPRKVLVTIQFTVSVALIIGTIVVFQQIQHAKNRPVGYERDGIIQFFTNSELTDKEDLMRTELLRTGVLEEVGFSSSPMTQIWSNQIGFDWEGKDPESFPSFGVVAVSPEFGKTVQWEVLEGRDFSRDMTTDMLNLILNESAVAQTGIEDIVDKEIIYNKKPCRVIGVVKDMLMESPYMPVKPTVFLVEASWTSLFTARLKKDVPVADALAKIENVYTTMSPSSPFDYTFVDDDYDQKFRSEERIGKLARVFAFLAIFISCLGLFGLSAFVAEQRTKEIGIRKVLGASVVNLWSLQSKSFVGLVVFSCLIAAPLAWYYLDDWLTSYDYRIELNWMTFLFAGILALIVTLVTVSYQSLKAALANPVQSLRSE